MRICELTLCHPEGAFTATEGSRLPDGRFFALYGRSV
jgi:hypothetical protein